MKATIIGRPGRVIEKGAVAITTMTGGHKTPSLPKGLPQPPATEMTWVVYMAAKQWGKVKAAVEGNPAADLIVEGYPVFERRLGPEGTMTLYAQKVMRAFGSLEAAWPLIRQLIRRRLRRGYRIVAGNRPE